MLHLGIKRWSSSLLSLTNRGLYKFIYIESLDIALEVLLYFSHTLGVQFLGL